MSTNKEKILAATATYLMQLPSPDGAQIDRQLYAIIYPKFDLSQVFLPKTTYRALSPDGLVIATSSAASPRAALNLRTLSAKRALSRCCAPYALNFS